MTFFFFESDVLLVDQTRQPGWLKVVQVNEPDRRGHASASLLQTAGSGSGRRRPVTL
jgi:hypothetical protein